jgi:hypothetical protein
MSAQTPLPAAVETLVSRWRLRRALAGLLTAAALALPLASIAVAAGGSAVGLALLATLATALIGGLLSGWTAGGGQPALPVRLLRHLDRCLPGMEDSAELLLSEPGALAGLPRLQRARVLERLEQTPTAVLTGTLPWTAVRRAGAGLAAAAVLALGVLFAWPAAPGRTAAVRSQPSTVAAESTPGQAPRGPAIESIEIRIAPPEYTGLRPRTVRGPTVAGLDVQAEAGSLLTWTVTTSGPVTALTLELGDSSRALATRPRQTGTFGGFLRVTEPAIYRLVLAPDTAAPVYSAFARLSVIPDRPPEVRLVEPRPTVEIAFEALGPLSIEAEARDDYGLGEAALVATLATGSGEQVRFREERWGFDSRTPLADGTGVRLLRRLDLATLELEPGAELFYAVEVTDNRRPVPQMARSATQRIRVPGGRGASVALGEGLAIRPVPEYFRSQRQIILDTEALLADRSNLTDDEFAYRSSLIGFDQSALRQRYGTLLGLEVENEGAGGEATSPDETGHVGGDAEHGHGAEPIPNPFEDAPASGRLIDVAPAELVHMHDSAEVSTFFTSAVRDTLRACLAAMWEAERRLRVAEAAAALPHENEALELLKQAQQAARVYVKRVGFEPPPLDPEGQRLSGDLDKIATRRVRTARTPLEASVVERALTALQQWNPPENAGARDGGSSPLDPGLLDAAARALAAEALGDPLSEITGLDAISRLAQHLRAGDAPTRQELAAAEAALWRGLDAPAQRPTRGDRAGSGALWSAYRKALSPP